MSIDFERMHDVVFLKEGEAPSGNGVFCTRCRWFELDERLRGIDPARFHICPQDGNATYERRRAWQGCDAVRVDAIAAYERRLAIAREAADRAQAVASVMPIAPPPPSPSSPRAEEAPEPVAEAPARVRRACLASACPEEATVDIDRFAVGGPKWFCPPHARAHLEARFRARATRERLRRLARVAAVGAGLGAALLGAARIAIAWGWLS